MKKFSLLFVVTILMMQMTSFSQSNYGYSNPSTSPTYTGGAVRGLYNRFDLKTLVINTTVNNLGNGSSNYLVTLDGCASNLTPVTVNDLNLATSANGCFVGFAHSARRRDTSWVFGNAISITTGNNCVFAKPDLAENVYTISNQFVYTGTNKAIAQISGATFFPDGITMRVWNNSHLTTPIEINGVAVPWVADLNLTTGAVTPRADLMPSLASPLTGTPKITSIDITSAGEAIQLGYFNRINGITVAQKGIIENLSTLVKTDLAVDNDAFVFTGQYVEANGMGLIGYTNPTPPVGISSGLFKFNPLTYNLSACGTGFGINPQDLLVDGVKVIVVGSPRTTPAGGTVGEFNTVTNVWTNQSGSLYTTPGASSSVNFVIGTNCNCKIMAGNFSSAFGTGSPRASAFTDLVKACDLGVILPVRITSFTGNKVGDNNILNWTTATEVNSKGFEVQRSTDGINYSTIAFVNSRASGGNSSSSLSYTYNDNTVARQDYYYRLNQLDLDGRGKLTSIILIKDNVSMLVIDKVYPNPVVDFVNLSLSSPKNQSITLNITDMSGKQLTRYPISLQKGSNAVQVDFSKFSSGIYLLRIGEISAVKITKQ